MSAVRLRNFVALRQVILRCNKKAGAFFGSGKQPPKEDKTQH
jgi:hypothetical protein